MDVSRVIDGLWIASTFYPWDDDMPPNPVVIDCRTLRDDTSDQSKQIEAIAWVICRAYPEWTKGKTNVVLLCDAGRNRSAVVAATVLTWLGYDDPIGMVREARKHLPGGALTNPAFVEYLSG